MKEFWNDRFNSDDYIYGKEPNRYFASFINKANYTGHALFPAEGEGRNAVFAAEKGWKVTAFDQSEVARDKALKLAEERNAGINYQLSDALEFETEEKFNLIVIIFLHLQPDPRKIFHKNIIKHLKKDGCLLMEVFSKKQINHDTGGPKNPEMLYTTEMLESDFNELKIIRNEALTVHLKEGDYHSGEAEVIRFAASKI